MKSLLEQLALHDRTLRANLTYPFIAETRSRLTKRDMRLTIPCFVQTWGQSGEKMGEHEQIWRASVGYGREQALNACFGG